MLKHLRYNFRIHKILRRLAKQRVKTVFQPGNIWLIEYAVEDNEETDALLKTCFMRGWVEPLKDSVPMQKLGPDGSLPKGNLFESHAPVWKLTDSGWAIIQRRHFFMILGLIVALTSSY